MFSHEFLTSSPRIRNDGLGLLCRLILFNCLWIGYAISSYPNRRQTIKGRGWQHLVRRELEEEVKGPFLNEKGRKPSGQIWGSSYIVSCQGVVQLGVPALEYFLGFLFKLQFLALLCRIFFLDIFKPKYHLPKQSSYWATYLNAEWVS